jgi:hypothetical protein
LTSGGGNASASGTWQDYTVTFTTGPSVSGDLTVELADAGAANNPGEFRQCAPDGHIGCRERRRRQPITVTNYSFEAETDPSIGVPSSWTAFNDANFSTVTTAVGNGYTAAADGNNFFAINEGPTDLPGGIYQDVGALQPNTRYTLTVATGRQSGFNQGSGLGSPANYFTHQRHG